MMTYIAVYKATNRIIQIEEHACFTWQQESGDIDLEMLAEKIKRERSIHFFNLVVGDNYHVQLNEITVTIEKTGVFTG
tara:strand:- start:175347 stop:175580 length:234 start_codon:yes stop_codon:yes gene_type:complete